MLSIADNFQLDPVPKPELDVCLGNRREDTHHCNQLDSCRWKRVHAYCQIVVKRIAESVSTLSKSTHPCQNQDCQTSRYRWRQCSCASWRPTPTQKPHFGEGLPCNKNLKCESLNILKREFRLSMLQGDRVAENQEHRTSGKIHSVKPNAMVCKSVHLLGNCVTLQPKRPLVFDN